MVSAIKDPVVIVGMTRTPMGGLQGVLAPLTATDLGGAAIRGALANAGLAANVVDEVLMGCVLSAGLGQAPARQAAFNAGIGKHTPCTTINKMCGSGMKAIMLAHDALHTGSADIVVAGGMESMTNAPYLLPKARSGYRFGHAELLDHMLYDGLQDAYSGGSMGSFAEQCVEAYGFSRESQDQYAIESLRRALAAIRNGAFACEITAVQVATRGGDTLVDTDEQPGNASKDKIPLLKPAFREGGTVTAANSSSISDGAAALVLTRQSEAEARGLRVLATIIGHSQYAAEPDRFPTAPVSAINSLLAKLGWTRDDIDLYEVNEAFAVVAMVAMQELNIPRDKINIHGGACALGHPIGASGARIVVTLLNALQLSGGHRGIASLCIGGGEATAMGFSVS